MLWELMSQPTNPPRKWHNLKLSNLVKRFLIERNLFGLSTVSCNTEWSSMKWIYLISSTLYRKGVTDIRVITSGVSRGRVISSRVSRTWFFYSHRYKRGSRAIRQACNLLAFQSSFFHTRVNTLVIFSPYRQHIGSGAWETEDWSASKETSTCTRADNRCCIW